MHWVNKEADWKNTPFIPFSGAWQRVKQPESLDSLQVVPRMTRSTMRTKRQKLPLHCIETCPEHMNIAWIEKFDSSGNALLMIGRVYHVVRDSYTRLDVGSCRVWCRVYRREVPRNGWLNTWYLVPRPIRTHSSLNSHTQNWGTYGTPSACRFGPFIHKRLRFGDHLFKC